MVTTTTSSMSDDGSGFETFQDPTMKAPLNAELLNPTEGDGKSTTPAPGAPMDGWSNPFLMEDDENEPLGERLYHVPTKKIKPPQLIGYIPRLPSDDRPDYERLAALRDQPSEDDLPFDMRCGSNHSRKHQCVIALRFKSPLKEKPFDESSLREKVRSILAATNEGNDEEPTKPVDPPPQAKARQVVLLNEVDHARPNPMESRDTFETAERSDSIELEFGCTNPSMENENSDVEAQLIQVAPKVPKHDVPQPSFFSFGFMAPSPPASPKRHPARSIVSSLDGALTITPVGSDDGSSDHPDNHDDLEDANQTLVTTDQADLLIGCMDRLFLMSAIVPQDANAGVQERQARKEGAGDDGNQISNKNMHDDNSIYRNGISVASVAADVMTVMPLSPCCNMDLESAILDDPMPSRQLSQSSSQSSTVDSLTGKSIAFKPQFSEPRPSTSNGDDPPTSPSHKPTRILQRLQKQNGGEDLLLNKSIELSRESSAVSLPFDAQETCLALVPFGAKPMQRNNTSDEVSSERLAVANPNDDIAFGVNADNFSTRADGINDEFSKIPSDESITLIPDAGDESEDHASHDTENEGDESNDHDRPTYGLFFTRKLEAPAPRCSSPENPLRRTTLVLGHSPRHRPEMASETPSTEPGAAAPRPHSVIKNQAEKTQSRKRSAFTSPPLSPAANQDVLPSAMLSNMPLPISKRTLNRTESKDSYVTATSTSSSCCTTQHANTIASATKSHVREKSSMTPTRRAFIRKLKGRRCESDDEDAMPITNNRRKKRSIATNYYTSLTKQETCEVGSTTMPRSQLLSRKASPTTSTYRAREQTFPKSSSANCDARSVEPPSSKLRQQSDVNNAAMPNLTSVNQGIKLKSCKDMIKIFASSTSLQPPTRSLEASDGKPNPTSQREIPCIEDQSQPSMDEIDRPLRPTRRQPDHTFPPAEVEILSHSTSSDMLFELSVTKSSQDSVAKSVTNGAAEKGGLTLLHEASIEVDIHANLSSASSDVHAMLLEENMSYDPSKQLTNACGDVHSFFQHLAESSSDSTDEEDADTDRSTGDSNDRSTSAVPDNAGGSGGGEQSCENEIGYRFNRMSLHNGNKTAAHIALANTETDDDDDEEEEAHQQRPHEKISTHSRSSYISEATADSNYFDCMTDATLQVSIVDSKETTRENKVVTPVNVRPPIPSLLESDAYGRSEDMHTDDDDSLLRSFTGDNEDKSDIAIVDDPVRAQEQESANIVLTKDAIKKVLGTIDEATVENSASNDSVFSSEINIEEFHGMLEGMRRNAKSLEGRSRNKEPSSHSRSPDRRLVASAQHVPLPPSPCPSITDSQTSHTNRAYLNKVSNRSLMDFDPVEQGRGQVPSHATTHKHSRKSALEITTHDSDGGSSIPDEAIAEVIYLIDKFRTEQTGNVERAANQASAFSKTTTTDFGPLAREYLSKTRSDSCKSSNVSNEGAQLDDLVESIRGDGESDCVKPSVLQDDDDDDDDDSQDSVVDKYANFHDTSADDVKIRSVMQADNKKSATNKVSAASATVRSQDGSWDGSYLVMRKNHSKVAASFSASNRRTSTAQNLPVIHTQMSGSASVHSSAQSSTQSSHGIINPSFTTHAGISSQGSRASQTSRRALRSVARSIITTASSSESSTSSMDASASTASESSGGSSSSRSARSGKISRTVPTKNKDRVSRKREPFSSNPKAEDNTQSSVHSQGSSSQKSVIRPPKSIITLKIAHLESYEVVAKPSESSSQSYHSTDSMSQGSRKQRTRANTSDTMNDDDASNGSVASGVLSLRSGASRRSKKSTRSTISATDKDGKKKSRNDNEDAGDDDDMIFEDARDDVDAAGVESRGEIDELEGGDRYDSVDDEDEDKPKEEENDADDHDAGGPSTAGEKQLQNKGTTSMVPSPPNGDMDTVSAGGHILSAILGWSPRNMCRCDTPISFDEGDDEGKLLVDCSSMVSAKEREDQNGSSGDNGEPTTSYERSESPKHRQHHQQFHHFPEISESNSFLANSYSKMKESSKRIEEAGTGTVSPGRE